jgi:hypothetical protein
MLLVGGECISNQNVANVNEVIEKLEKRFPDDLLRYEDSWGGRELIINVLKNYKK